MLYVLIIILVGIFIIFGLRIADQYQRAVVFRLGRYQATRGPGLYWIIPLIEWKRTLDIRTVTAAVEQQETITKDNVPVKINAVVWYRIFDPKRALLECDRSTTPSFKSHSPPCAPGSASTRSMMCSRSRRRSPIRSGRRSIRSP